jgi:hypothetical protein
MRLIPAFDGVARGATYISPDLVAVPAFGAELVTVTFPEAPRPTIAVICVEEFTTIEVAEIPPNLTLAAVTPVNPVPVITTLVLCVTVVGEKDEIVGACPKEVKLVKAKSSTSNNGGTCLFFKLGNSVIIFVII